MGTDLHAGRADHSVDPLSHGEARGSLDDPPPYESIIMGTARPLEAAITVFVTDPVRQLEGVRSFVSYRVTYRPASGPGSSVHPAGVIRRFSDFDWLKKQLRANHRGCIVPPLPEKNVVEKYKLTDEFIEQRRAALAVFMNRLAAHPVLRHSPAFQLFLDADEAGFAREVARTAGEAGGAGPLEAAITVFVTDPVRQLEGVRSFVSYRVTYRPASGPGSSVHPAGVIRRFSDFDWLKKQLRANHRGCIVPPLPEKNVVEKYKLTDEFIEQRRAALAVFMNRLAAHPVLRHSPAFQLFLDADEAGFAREVAQGGKGTAIATRMSSELVAFQRQRAEELSAVLRRFATLVAAGEGAAAKTWAPLARGADA
ncbi:Vacuolar protein sorting-associated protein vps5 [Auxenochlorella protothecoides]|uniref:Vacuolar protein sorting-associated protein vps5 n=1 Tax=Auxenochlorella protothecoides TaxID=3075 RepID=A0A087SRS2_AUXPR|nr:Vacuolar protein sorting-associated protein vps5 [Auxenochlorella protothecoides]KFM28426.1 Vacuolar protein sorting-associated protein vps5 [Auxenochlorella protothecoides]